MEVQVLFESRNLEAALRDLAVRRTRFALRRLVGWQPRAQLKLSDINGPRGGNDKRCQVKIETDGAGTVIATSMARDWRAALDDALERAVRRLTRLWRRAYVHHRPRPRALPIIKPAE
jgi:ribosome-associated translation inhibitor RaiA